MLGCVGAASAADLDVVTKAPRYTKAPAGPTTCGDVQAYFLTDCQLAWYGVRFYGTIDIGYGYQTNGAALNKYTSTGLTYLPGKMNNGGKWLVSPNAMGASNIGFQIKEPLGAGWSLVGQVETAFDPATFGMADGPRSLGSQVGQPLGLAQGVSDSALQGMFYDSLGYVGVSNDAWGTLTFLRQKNLMIDTIGFFDPVAGSNAFSLISASGTYGGGGDTENTRGTTSAKYRLNYANFHFGAFAQFGDYSDGNASKGMYQGELGADFHVGPGLLSLDGVGGYTKDAVSEALAGYGVLASGFGNPNSVATGLTATISDNSYAMFAAKYTVDRLKVYAGYEWIQYANPSDSVTSFTDIAGYNFLAGSIYGISTTAFSHGDKVLNVAWTGASYAITDTLSVTGAYYHVSQNDYSGGLGSTSAGDKGKTCATLNTAQSSCSGSQDVASFLVDWKFAPKWDTYFGTMYTKLNGGMASGYLADNNWTTLGGFRFRW
jgi:predicted porin